jgi:hypothetical protein
MLAGNTGNLLRALSGAHSLGYSGDLGAFWKLQHDW